MGEWADWGTKRCCHWQCQYPKPQAPGAAVSSVSRLLASRPLASRPLASACQLWPPGDCSARWVVTAVPRTLSCRSTSMWSRRSSITGGSHTRTSLRCASAFCVCLLYGVCVCVVCVCVCVRYAHEMKMSMRVCVRAY